MRALVVDDEPLVRSELVYALGKIGAGIEVGEAGDAVEALRALAEEPYDVVFLDINLPGLSGIEASRVIGKLERAPQIVFVTADDSHAVDAFELAAVDYVVKPVSQARLARTVARLRPPREAAPAAQGARRCAPRAPARPA